MFRTRQVIALIAILVAGAGAAAGEVLVLADGTTLIGEVSEVTADSVTFEYERSGNMVEATFERSRLAPHSWYVIRARALADDAQARVELARFAADNGLFALAERDLRRAIEKDDSLEPELRSELASVREGAAARLVALAEERLSQGDLDDAWDLAATVLTKFRETAGPSAARPLLDRIEEARAAVAEQAEQRARAQLAREEVERRESAVRPARSLLELGHRRVVSGLKADGLNDSMRRFSAGARAYERALAKADDIERVHGNDMAIVEMLDEIRSDAVEGMVGAHVNMGSLYVVRGSYPTALRHANEALAVDNSSSQAQAFRARVEIASAEASRGRFRR